jgi:predicted nucleic acid-binding protein
MRVFLDTNVLLDVLARREPFYGDSVAVWTLAEQRKIHGLVSVISFTNLFYIVGRLQNRRAALRVLTMLRDTFTPVLCDDLILNQAMDAGFDDFEDAVQYFSALRAETTCVVSRNPEHFPRSELAVLTPTEFLAAHSFK